MLASGPNSLVHAAQRACFGARQLPCRTGGGTSARVAMSPDVSCSQPFSHLLHATEIEAVHNMRLDTLIVPVLFLCLLALAIWKTSHALPGYSLDIIGHLIDLSHSPYDNWLWLDLLWGLITPRLTLTILYLAISMFLGTAYGVYMQLQNGSRLLTYVLCF